MDFKKINRIVDSEGGLTAREKRLISKAYDESLEDPETIYGVVELRGYQIQFELNNDDHLDYAIIAYKLDNGKIDISKPEYLYSNPEDTEEYPSLSEVYTLIEEFFEHA